MPAGSRSLNRQVTRAMSAQLDRVNAQRAQERIAELEREVERLQNLLQLAHTRIRDLEAQQNPTLDPDITDRPAPSMAYHGRAATTPQKAAEFYGVHISTIIRRLQSGKIAGEQMPGTNRWIVFLDKPIGSFRSYAH